MTIDQQVTEIIFGIEAERGGHLIGDQEAILKIKQMFNDAIASKDKEIAELKEEVKRLSEWHNDKEREADAECLSIAVAEAEQEFHAKNDEELKELKAKNFDLQSELSQLKEYVEVMHKTEDKYRKQIQSLQEEIKHKDIDLEAISLTANIFREEMKKRRRSLNYMNSKHIGANFSSTHYTVEMSKEIVIKQTQKGNYYFEDIKISPSGLYPHCITIKFESHGHQIEKSSIPTLISALQELCKEKEEVK